MKIRVTTPRLVDDEVFLPVGEYEVIRGINLNKLLIRLDSGETTLVKLNDVEIVEELLS